LSNNYPAGVTSADKLLVNEALKGAQTVIVYNLGASHTAEVLAAAMNKLKTIQFNILCYPYDGTSYAANKTSIVTWMEAMRTSEGVKAQVVLANQAADKESVINVANGVVLSDGTTLTAAQVTAWVAGVTAGANINQSNTGKKYMDAIDVSPRMTKSEMEAAITAGKFIFKVDSVQNVTAVYDINSFVSATPDKGKEFMKNRVIRTVDGINNDIAEIFESNFIGKTNNNEDGRRILRSYLVDYFNEMQRMSAITNFKSDDVTVIAGADSDAVVINCYIQPVDSVEKIYISVNLA